MAAISVKDLRSKFPFVRSELKKGTQFLIVFKNKPIAQLSPINKEIDETAEFEALAVDEMENDFLSDEELNYYLNLKEYGT